MKTSLLRKKVGEVILRYIKGRLYPGMAIFHCYIKLNKTFRSLTKSTTHRFKV